MVSLLGSRLNDLPNGGPTGCAAFVTDIGDHGSSFESEWLSLLFRRALNHKPGLFDGDAVHNKKTQDK